MKRETELLIKGATIEITKVLRDFDEIMNAKLGDTVNINTGKEVITRKATFQDNIDFMQSEWFNTKDKLSDIGIDLELEKEAPKNHYEVYGKLLDLANNEKETSLDYKEMILRFDMIFIDENGLGDSSLTLHRNGFNDEIARILLKGNREYVVVESEAGSFAELIEK